MSATQPTSISTSSSICSSSTCSSNILPSSNQVVSTPPAVWTPHLFGARRARTTSTYTPVRCPPRWMRHLPNATPYPELREDRRPSRTTRERSPRRGQPESLWIALKVALVRATTMCVHHLCCRGKTNRHQSWWPSSRIRDPRETPQPPL